MIKYIRLAVKAAIVGNLLWAVYYDMNMQALVGCLVILFVFDEINDWAIGRAVELLGGLAECDKEIINTLRDHEHSKIDGSAVLVSKGKRL